ncbi:hypothetical protein POM88_019027 [Heracleum sosnowskyi]|uniref:Uncharacterized protein n=1 Tax=Heracleum sosnowskyi TaxID=360622 RepID=A0AAD8IRK8_9APIA|nr:hypothetical protein POM88_019027 [Heracleum sosnowskyi]
MSLSNRKQLQILLHPLLFHSISLREFSTSRSAIDDCDDDASSDADASKKTNASKSHSALSRRPLCTSILAPSLTVVSYPSMPTSRTSYSDFVINYRDFDMCTRSYVARFPKMLSFPEKPDKAMDTLLLKTHAEPEEFKDVTPSGAVTEMKYAVTRNPLRNSKAPCFKVHNYRASYEDSEGRIVNLIRNVPKQKEDPALLKFLMAMAKKLIDEDLKKHEINKADLEKLWFEESRTTEKTEAMWCQSLVKHYQFSLYDLLLEYASTTYKLAKPVLEGTEVELESGELEHQLGLGEFLLKEGFVVGKYHDVKKLMESLKRFFGVDVFPTFVGHGAYHPSLFEVGVLTTKDGAKRIDHPMASKVPEGLFLMREL